MSEHALAEILDWFNELEEHVPGISSTVGEIVFGKIPNARAVNVYNLADQWDNAAEQVASFAEEAGKLASPILESWTGDQAAMQFAQQWLEYQQGLNTAIQSLSGMAGGVRSFGLEIESLKWLVLINLITLALTIYALVAAMLATFGISGAGIPAAYAAARAAISAGASKALSAIAGISARTVIRELPRLGVLALPTAARAGVPAVSRLALPTAARTALPTVVRTQLPNLIRTQLPHIIRTQLPNLVRTAAPALGRAAANYARTLPANLARQVLPRNVIARSVADRLANQWMRSMASRALLRELGRQAGAKGVTNAALAGARSAMAWHIEQQLLRKFGATAAEQLVSRGAGASVARLTESAIAREATTSALSQHAVRATAEMSFGRELARYIGVRAAAGAGLMGGGDLFGQMLQVADGNRTSLDFGKAALLGGQGAAFGVGMWGGPAGHVVGGGVVGGGYAAAVEAVGHANGESFDWGEVAYQAGHGAAAGVVFGGMNPELLRMNMPMSRIGQDVAVVPDSQTGRTGLLTRDPKVGADVALDGQRGAIWQRHGESAVHVTDMTGTTRTADPAAPADAAAAGARGGSAPPADGPAPSPDGPPPPDGPSSPTGPSRPDGSAPPRLEPAPADRTGGAGPDPGPDGTPAVVRPPGPDSPSTGGAEQPPPVRRAETVPGDVPVEVTRTPDGVEVQPGGDPLVARDGDTAPGQTPAGRTTAGDPGAADGLSGVAREPDGRVLDRGPEPRMDTPAVSRSDTPAGSRAEALADPRADTPVRADILADPRADAPPDRARDVEAPAPDGRSPATPRPVSDDPAGPLPERAPRSDRDEPLYPPPGFRPEAGVDPLVGDPGGHPPEPALTLAAAGAETGEPPSPRSIEQGTVRMEEHPDYPHVLRELDELGYSTVPTEGDPRVVIRQVLDRQGNILAVHHEVHVRPGMRFLDLEHELGHVHQVTDPARFPAGPLPNEQVLERPDGRWVKPKMRGPSLKDWQNAGLEYHVRLQEYIRLAERGVDDAVLREHAAGIAQWRDLYRKGLAGGREAENRSGWMREHLPDIPELRERVDRLLAGEDATTGDRDTGDGATAGDGGDSASGARIRPSDDLRAMEWAAEAYDRFRATDDDVPEIADNLRSVDRPDGGHGFTRDEIAQVKRHLMVEEHLLDDYEGGTVRSRFDPDEDIAEAWIRLREGRHLPEDLVLLEHELAESNYLRTHPEATYREAHTYADSRHNWSEVNPGRTGEDLDVRWGRESSRGDTSGLSEGPGGQSGGRIRFWPFRRSEPADGGGEGLPAGETAGRRSGQELHQGVREDSPVPPEQRPLAGERVVRGVADGPPTAPTPESTPTSGQRPGEDWFAPYDDGPVAPPVIGGEQVTFRDPPPARPDDPAEITPDWVRDTLADPATPAPQAEAVQRYLVEPGGSVPRSGEEIAATLDQLRGEATAAVTPPAAGPAPDTPAPYGGDAGRAPYGEDAAPAPYGGDTGRSAGEENNPAPHGAQVDPARQAVGVDEYWNDPPWLREQRRPSLDELIPGLDSEVGRWEAAVRAEFARQLDGREFAGMRLRLDPTDPASVSVYRDSVTVRVDVVDPGHGLVGKTTRTFLREHDGTLVVEHNTTKLYEAVQGRGFARQWNRFLEDWYEYSGVDRIEVRASFTVGGFAWARDGYDWAPNTAHRAEAVFGALRSEMRVVRDEIAQVDRWVDGDRTVDIDRLRQRYGVDDPTALTAEMQRQYDDGRQVLDRAAEHPFGSAEYPTPFEVAYAGWNGQHGRDADWLGKRAMLDAGSRGTDWKGVKPISDDGPRLPRPPLTDERGPDVIAAEETRSMPAHGGERAPDATLDAVWAAVDDLSAGRLPAESGYTVTPVRRMVDGELVNLLEVATSDRRQPSVLFRFATDAVPDGTPAFTVPTGHQVDGRPVMLTTISDSIPAEVRDQAVRRLLVHELGHTVEELRPRGIIDRLRQGGGFGPHARGLLAELRVELADLTTAPAGQRQQRIGELLDLLGGADRLGQIIARVESGGPTVTPEIRGVLERLAAPEAPWRAELARQRQQAATDAVVQAVRDLSGDRVELIEQGQLLSAGPELELVVRVRTRPAADRPTEVVDLPVTDLVDQLAESTAAGQRLRARAVAGVLTELGQVWSEGPGPTVARAMARLQDALPAELGAEYRRGLETALAGLSADELAALRTEPLPRPVRNRLPERVADAVLTETVPELTGNTLMDLAVDVRWRDDGGWSVTSGNRVFARTVPAEVVERIRGWVTGRVADGVELPEIRAELAAVLAEELKPYTAARPETPTASRALAALARLADSDIPGSDRVTLRDAARSVAGEVLAANPLIPSEWRALPSKARELVETVPSVPRRALASDPHQALRPTVHEQLVTRVTEGTAAFVDQPATAGPADLAGLTTTVDRLVTVLGEAEAGLERRMTARVDSAAKAEEQALDKEREAAAERDATDQWAGERRREALAEAGKQRVIAERHVGLATRYEVARDQARAALDAYRVVATELADLTADPRALEQRADALAGYAAEAAEAYGAYRQAMAGTGPVRLETSIPTEQLPHRRAVTDTVNRMLAERGLEVTFTPDQFQRQLLSRWGRVAGADGEEIPLGGGARLRVRFRPGDPVEDVQSGREGAELANAQLPQYPQGSRTFTSVMNRKLGLDQTWDPGAIANWLGEYLPDTQDIIGLFGKMLRALVLRPSLEASRTTQVAGSAALFSLPGAVLAVKNDIRSYDVAGSYELQLRTGDGPWSEPVVVDRPGDGDRTGLSALVPHSVVEPAPAEPTTIEQPRTAQFPEHAVILSGVGELKQTTLRQMEQAGLRTDGAARERIDTLVGEEFPARLEQAVNNPGGWHRTLVDDDGRPVGILQIRTRVDLESPELVGAPSRGVQLERLRIAFVQAGGSTTVQQRWGAGLEVGLRWPDGQGGAYGSLTGNVGLSAADTYSANVTRLAIHPNVQRYTGHVQGYDLRLTHEVTVADLDSVRRASDLVDGSGLFHMPEADAYRYGLPVDRAAVRRDADGAEVMRDDPLPGPPPGRADRLPAFFGPGGIPGAGPADVQRMTGIREVREQVERWGRAEGWLPEMDADGFPVFSRGQSLMERVSLLGNMRAVAELNPNFLEGVYDQLTQHGVPLTLMKQRPQHGTEHATLLVTLRQERAVLVGHTDAESVVNLDISRQVTTRTSGEVRDRSRGGGVQVGPDYGGGGSGGRTSTRSSSWQRGDVVHQATLVETPERVPNAVVQVSHTLEVRKLIDGPDPRSGIPVARSGDVTARVVWPGDMLPRVSEESRPTALPATGPSSDAAQLPPASTESAPAEVAPSPAEAASTSAEAAPTAPAGAVPAVPSAEPVSPAVLTVLKVVHLDASAFPEAVRKLLPSTYRPGSPTRLHLSALTDVRQLIVNPTWLEAGTSEQFGATHRGLRTDHAVDNRGASPTRGTLSVRGRLRDLTFEQAVRLVSSDVNFALDLTEVGIGRQRAGSFDAAGGTPYGGGSYHRTGSSGMSRIEESDQVRERLDPVVGIHYFFSVRADVDITGVEAHQLPGVRDTRSSPELVEDVPVVGVMTEREALELYADGHLPLPEQQIKDVLTRYDSGKLKLDEFLAARITKRFRADLADAGLTGPVERVPTAREHPEADAYRLPEHLRDALGQAGVEPIRFVEPDGSTGMPVDLFNEVANRVEEVAPGALERLPGLHASLDNLLGGRAWTGRFDRMLKKDGWLLEDFRLPTGRYSSESLNIRIRAEFLPTGDGREGWYRGRADDLSSITQDYGFDREDVGGNRGVSHSGGGAGGAPTPFEGSVNAGRSYSSSQSNSSILTWIQRIGSFDGVDRFERPVRLTVEVWRERPGLLNLPKRLADAVSHRGVPHRSSRPEVGDVSVVQRVPTGLLVPKSGDSAAELPTPPAAVPGGVFPDNAFVESVHLGDLTDPLAALLADGELLGRRGLATHLDDVRRAVTVRSSDAGLAWIRPGGERLMTLPVPGRPQQRVDVYVEFEPVHYRAVSGFRPDVQAGHDTRMQGVTAEGDNRELIKPVGRGLAYGDEGVFGVQLRTGLTNGMSGNEIASLVVGDRDEWKGWRSLRDVATFRADLTARMVAVRKTVRPDGTEATEYVDQLSSPAGHAYLTASLADLVAAATESRAAASGQVRVGEFPPAESGRRVLPGWPGGRGDPPERLALEGLHAEIARRPDGGHSPVDVADLVHRRVGDAWRRAPALHLTAGPEAGRKTDPLATAMEVARRRDGDVVVEFREPNGGLRMYGVGPDGSVAPVLPDDGFAAEWNALPAELRKRAHRAGLDPRGLFHSAGGELEQAVTDALAGSGRQVSSGPAGDGPPSVGESTPRAAGPAGGLPEPLARLLGELPRGRQAHVRMVPDEPRLRTLFTDLISGGEQLPAHGSKIPEVYRLPDGTVVQWRVASRSGGATIDIFPPQSKGLKVHVE